MPPFDGSQPGVNVCVIGASGGIGAALVRSLEQDESVQKIYAFARSDTVSTSPKTVTGQIDIIDEESIQKAADSIAVPLHAVIIATGLLADETVQPEKSLRDLDIDAMRRVFEVNSFGPALVMKHFVKHLPRKERSVVAAISARVGSISDNQIGGWHTYRASKSALNMFLKNVSIEVARKYPMAAVIGLHPGTVDTDLSKPFQGNVKHDIFTSDQSAAYLINVINGVSAEDTGKIFAYDGIHILP